MAAKRTPLYERHLAHGAKVIDFHGWEMPVQYQSILSEHQAVRTKVGLFDVSHMGEFLIEGEDAEALVQYIVTNDVSRIHAGQALYTLMTDEQGGIIDDLLVYKQAADKLMLVVNAGNIEVDYGWVTAQADAFAAHVSNVSDEMALIAVQGPEAASLVQGLTLANLDALKPFTFVEAELLSKRVLLSRTGYTGEDGFELYLAGADASEVFDTLIERGAVPCGLGARDTLRLEARLSLYGNELSREVSPYEAGLGMFVKLQKGDFIGRDALRQQKEQGVTRKLVGIQMMDKSIPRTGYAVLVGDTVVGRVTSGTLSPTLQVPIGLVLIDVSYATVDQALDIDIRGRRHPARVVPTPFYQRKRV